MAISYLPKLNFEKNHQYPLFNINIPLTGTDFYLPAVIDETKQQRIFVTDQNIREVLKICGEYAKQHPVFGISYDFEIWKSAYFKKAVLINYIDDPDRFDWSAENVVKTFQKRPDLLRQAFDENFDPLSLKPFDVAKHYVTIPHWIVTFSIDGYDFIFIENKLLNYGLIPKTEAYYGKASAENVFKFFKGWIRQMPNICEYTVNGGDYDEYISNEILCNGDVWRMNAIHFKNRTTDDNENRKYARSWTELNRCQDERLRLISTFMPLNKAYLPIVNYADGSVYDVLLESKAGATDEDVSAIGLKTFEGNTGTDIEENGGLSFQSTDYLDLTAENYAKTIQYNCNDTHQTLSYAFNSQEQRQNAKFMVIKELGQGMDVAKMKDLWSSAFYTAEQKMTAVKWFKKALKTTLNFDINRADLSKTLRSQINDVTLLHLCGLDYLLDAKLSDDGQTFSPDGQSIIERSAIGLMYRIRLWHEQRYVFLEQLVNDRTNLMTLLNRNPYCYDDFKLPSDDEMRTVIEKYLQQQPVQLSLTGMTINDRRIANQIAALYKTIDVQMTDIYSQFQQTIQAVQLEDAVTNCNSTYGNKSVGQVTAKTIGNNIIFYKESRNGFRPVFVNPKIRSDIDSISFDLPFNREKMDRLVYEIYDGKIIKLRTAVDFIRHPIWFKINYETPWFKNWQNCGQDFQQIFKMVESWNDRICYLTYHWPNKAEIGHEILQSHYGWYWQHKDDFLYGSRPFRFIDEVSMTERNNWTDLTKWTVKVVTTDDDNLWMKEQYYSPFFDHQRIYGIAVSSPIVAVETVNLAVVSPTVTDALPIFGLKITELNGKSQTFRLDLITDTMLKQFNDRLGYFKTKPSFQKRYYAVNFYTNDLLIHCDKANNNELDSYGKINNDHLSIQLRSITNRNGISFPEKKVYKGIFYRCELNNQNWPIIADQLQGGIHAANRFHLPLEMTNVYGIDLDEAAYYPWLVKCFKNAVWTFNVVFAYWLNVLNVTLKHGSASDKKARIGVKVVSNGVSGKLGGTDRLSDKILNKTVCLIGEINNLVYLYAFISLLLNPELMDGHSYDEYLNRYRHLSTEELAAQMDRDGHSLVQFCNLNTDGNYFLTNKTGLKRMKQLNSFFKNGFSWNGIQQLIDNDQSGNLKRFFDEEKWTEYKDTPIGQVWQNASEMSDIFISMAQNGVNDYAGIHTPMTDIQTNRPKTYQLAVQNGLTDKTTDPIAVVRKVMLKYVDEPLKYEPAVLENVKTKGFTGSGDSWTAVIRDSSVFEPSNNYQAYGKRPINGYLFIEKLLFNRPFENSLKFKRNLIWYAEVVKTTRSYDGTLLKTITDRTTLLTNKNNRFLLVKSTDADNVYGIFKVKDYKELTFDDADQLWSAYKTSGKTVQNRHLRFVNRLKMLLKECSDRNYAVNLPLMKIKDVEVCSFGDLNTEIWTKLADLLNYWLNLTTAECRKLNGLTKTTMKKYVDLTVVPKITAETLQQYFQSVIELTSDGKYHFHEQDYSRSKVGRTDDVTVSTDGRWYHGISLVNAALSNYKLSSDGQLNIGQNVYLDDDAYIDNTKSHFDKIIRLWPLNQRLNNRTIDECLADCSESQPLFANSNAEKTATTTEIKQRLKIDDRTSLIVDEESSADDQKSLIDDKNSQDDNKKALIDGKRNKIKLADDQKSVFGRQIANSNDQKAKSKNGRLTKQQQDAIFSQWFKVR